MDLAAPFGPVTGLTTSVHFTDLLEIGTAPHQVATVATINPGITVSDGVIHYQLLPQQPGAASSAASGRSWAAS